MNKTNHAFSLLPIDQGHKQNKKIVKGDGGAIGLTESSTQLLWWMVSGPELSRLINDFLVSQKLVRNVAKQFERSNLASAGMPVQRQGELEGLCQWPMFRDGIIKGFRSDQIQ